MKAMNRRLLLKGAAGVGVAAGLGALGRYALLAPPRGARDWARTALVALITAAATYYVFEHYLTVLLPRGRWTDF